MSCGGTELLEQETGHNIPIANATRWSSTYIMLNAIVKTETDKKGVLDRVAEKVGSSVRLTEKDMLTIKELCTLLEPIATLTTRLQVNLAIYVLRLE
jgi:hypothetical protein